MVCVFSERYQTFYEVKTRRFCFVSACLVWDFLVCLFWKKNGSGCDCFKIVLCEEDVKNVLETSMAGLFRRFLEFPVK